MVLEWWIKIQPISLYFKLRPFNPLFRSTYFAANRERALMLAPK
jgi:hypothetical protein